jgi:hypothetical protein
MGGRSFYASATVMKNQNVPNPSHAIGRVHGPFSILREKSGAIATRKRQNPAVSCGKRGCFWAAFPDSSAGVFFTGCKNCRHHHFPGWPNISPLAEKGSHDLAITEFVD